MPFSKCDWMNGVGSLFCMLCVVMVMSLICVDVGIVAGDVDVGGGGGGVGDGDSFVCSGSFVRVGGDDRAIGVHGVGEWDECSGDGACVDCEDNESGGSTGCTVGNLVGGGGCESNSEGVYDTADRLGEDCGRGCRGCAVVSVGWVWG